MPVAAHEADEVPGRGAVGVDARRRPLGLDARHAEGVDGPPLLRGQALGEVDEGGVAHELGAELGLVPVEQRREHLGRPRGAGAHHLPGVGVLALVVAHQPLVDADVEALDGGGEHLPVGVEDVPARGADEGGAGAVGLGLLGEVRALDGLDVHEPAAEDHHDGEQQGQGRLPAHPPVADGGRRGAPPAHPASPPPSSAPSARRMKRRCSAGTMPSSVARRCSVAGEPVSSTWARRDASASSSLVSATCWSWIS